MKYLKVFFFVAVFFVTHNIFAITGEVLFKTQQNSTVRPFSIKLNTSSYFWYKNNGEVVIGNTSNFPRYYSNKITYYFDSPDNINTAIR